MSKILSQILFCADSENCSKRRKWTEKQCHKETSSREFRGCVWTSDQLFQDGVFQHRWWTHDHLWGILSYLGNATVRSVSVIRSFFFFLFFFRFLFSPMFSNFNQLGLHNKTCVAFANLWWTINQNHTDSGLVLVL